MSVKKNKSVSQSESPIKLIKVKKLDSIKPVNEPVNESVTIPKDSIIKSNIKIMEPIVEIVERKPSMNTSSSIGIDKSKLKLKKEIIKNKSLAKEKVKDKDIITSEFDETEDTNDTNDTNDDGMKDEKKNDAETITESITEPIKDTLKAQKQDKIHNHSKPKTIIASTKDVNTVDMFGEDDLDFRYVMMNYDYTKNVTMPKITKYERALLIGKRAKQIEEGANPNVKYISGQSVVSIAEEELRQRKIPLIIKRPIGNKFEYWKPADMEVNMD